MAPWLLQERVQLKVHRYTLGIIHGFQAIDMALIQDLALNRHYRETIILSGVSGYIWRE